MAALPDPQPAPAVQFKSDGGVLIIGGPGRRALGWAERLADQLEVSVLVTQKGELPLERAFPLWSGKVTALSGWLGEFAVEWTQENPIDLEAVHALQCMRAGVPRKRDRQPAAGRSRQMHGPPQCVEACGAVGAIDFSRAERTRSERYRSVLDLSREPLLRPARSCRRAISRRRRSARASARGQKLAQLVGEFEKPKFFAYRAKICAHSRSGGRAAICCIDVCSTARSRADGDHVKVEPHLCVGCGGCTTVCPSGAMPYDYPRVSDTRHASEDHACAPTRCGRQRRLHPVPRCAPRAALDCSRGRGQGLPARVIPVELLHVASIGSTAARRARLRRQPGDRCRNGEKHRSIARRCRRRCGSPTRSAEPRLRGHPLRRRRSGTWQALVAAVWSRSDALTMRGQLQPAPTSAHARLALEHLAKDPQAPEEITLPAGAPFGTLAVNKEPARCARPASAPVPSRRCSTRRDAELRFIETNCVQCGLCADTCPEDAIRAGAAPAARPQAKEPVTLNEAQPFNCVRCGKPFGTPPDGREHARQALGPLDVRRQHATPADVRRLPRGRHDGKQQRSEHLRLPET